MRTAYSFVCMMGKGSIVLVVHVLCLTTETFLRIMIRLVVSVSMCCSAERSSSNDVINRMGYCVPILLTVLITLDLFFKYYSVVSRRSENSSKPNGAVITDVTVLMRSSYFNRSSRKKVESCQKLKPFQNIIVLAMIQQRH